MKMNDYIVDSYYGLVYRADKAQEAIKYKTDDSRYIRRNVRKVLAESNSDLIDTIYIHPVGTKCLGNCVYCMNESFNTTNYETLSMDRYAKTLDYLVKKNYVSNDLVNISLTGGEPILSTDIEDILDISIEKLSRVFSFTLTTGMYYPDNIFDRLYDTAKNVVKRDIYSSTLSFSADLDGSVNRHSIKLNMTNEYITNRLLAYLPKFSDIDKTVCAINIRLNNDSDLITLIDNIYRVFTISNKAIVRLAIIDGPDNYLAEDKIPMFFDELKKHFKLSFANKGSFTLEITDKNTNYDDTFNNLMLKTLEDGIFIVHPLDQPCWTWSKFFGIGPSKYFACYFGFIESDNIDDLVVMNENNPFYNTYNLLGDGCDTCELLPFCKLCRRQRLLYPCTKIPALKEYMRQVYNIMISDPEKWCID